MPAKKYRVDLTAEERETLTSLIQSGKAAVRQVTRARILLKADEGLTDEEIAEEVATSPDTVERTRQRLFPREAPLLELVATFADDVAEDT